MTQMTASSGVVLANLAYLFGAVVFAFIGGAVVWWKHRKPTSVHANMASFHRGLKALAPDGEDDRPSATPGVRISPRHNERRPPVPSAREGSRRKAGVDRG